ncbi:MAG: dihydropteroate synthase [Ectothiorhodospiraceae bacterium]|jgi:dihydropteroate synthase
MSSVVLDCGGKPLDLDSPRVMGVLNITPDSFSDGGDFIEADAAIARAREMVAQGAAIVDVGGESTRPGAADVPVEEEIRRVVPVIEALAPALSVPVSVDTTKPEVIRAAARAGAGLINDVMALRRSGALEAAAEVRLPVCLMHMQGTPRTMQTDPRYDDVVEDVFAFLAERVEACEAAGIPRQRLVVDPGFGFGKNMGHNATLLHRLRRLADLGLPVLVGLSRKSFIGNILNKPADARLAGSLATAVMAAWNGAAIIRAHDVEATVDALRVTDYVIKHA